MMFLGMLFNMLYKGMIIKGKNKYVEPKYKYPILSIGISNIKVKIPLKASIFTNVNKKRGPLND